MSRWGSIPKMRVRVQMCVARVAPLLLRTWFLLFRGLCLTHGTYSLDHDPWNQRLGVRERWGGKSKWCYQISHSQCNQSSSMFKMKHSEPFKGIGHQLESEGGKMLGPPFHTRDALEQWEQSTGATAGKLGNWSTHKFCHSSAVWP